MVSIPKFHSTFARADEEVDIEDASNRIEHLEFFCHRLSDWEIEFVDSLAKQLDEKEWLSRAQYNKLIDLYEDHVE